MSLSNHFLVLLAERSEFTQVLWQPERAAITRAPTAHFSFQTLQILWSASRRPLALHHPQIRPHSLSFLLFLPLHRDAIWSLSYVISFHKKEGQKQDLEGGVGRQGGSKWKKKQTFLWSGSSDARSGACCSKMMKSLKDWVKNEIISTWRRWRRHLQHLGSGGSHVEPAASLNSAPAGEDCSVQLGNRHRSRWEERK